MNHTVLFVYTVSDAGQALGTMNFPLFPWTPAASCDVGGALSQRHLSKALGKATRTPVQPCSEQPQPRTWEDEAGESGVPGQPWLHVPFRNKMKAIEMLRLSQEGGCSQGSVGNAWSVRPAGRCRTRAPAMLPTPFSGKSDITASSPLTHGSLR